MNENDALRTLSQWLKSYRWEVLQDKINKNNNQVFHVMGESTKKPDLIGITPQKWIIAMEVKTGDCGKDLGKNSKLMQYYENYNDEKTYYIQRLEIDYQSIILLSQLLIQKMDV
jgi:hypothetical protein